MVKVAEFKDLVGTHNSENFVIICAGSTVKHYSEYIKELIIQTRAITIGVNNIYDHFTPYYHLWTNNQRFRDFGDNVSRKSKLIIGCKIKENIKRSYNYKYCNLNYSDIEEQIGYKDNFVHGRFRTAGILSIYLANLMGAKKIYVVGMDGYTLKYNGDQHCYGEGDTDSCDIKYEKEKDQLCENILHNIRNEVGDFEILTPTVHTQFYTEGLI